MFENIRTIRKFDPAAKSYLEVILCYPGLHALWAHGLAHFLYTINIPLFPRLINYFARMFTGIDIHPGAKISPGIMIDHGAGVVIGETAEIGSGCIIYQGVTLGGTGKQSGKRHPTLQKNVVVGAGAKILGNIVIEENVRVGAGSVVMRDVPSGCTVVGIPGKVIKDTRSDDSGMLDHNQMPDPVARVFSILVERIESLQKQISGKQSESINLEEEDRAINNFIDGDGI